MSTYDAMRYDGSINLVIPCIPGAMEASAKAELFRFVDTLGNSACVRDDVREAFIDLVGTAVSRGMDPASRGQNDLTVDYDAGEDVLHVNYNGMVDGFLEGSFCQLAQRMQPYSRDGYKCLVCNEDDSAESGDYYGPSPEAKLKAERADAIETALSQLPSGTPEELALQAKARVKLTAIYGADEEVPDEASGDCPGASC